MLEDASQSHDQHATKPWLKYDHSGAVPIILVPQPSDDPNDPLVQNPISSLDMACD